MAETQDSLQRDDIPETSGYQRMARVQDGRILAGVCTGLGRFTGIDPVVYRVGFGILVLAHGQGILLYIAAALFMPAHAGTGSLAEQLFRRWFDAAAVMAIMGGLLCFGVAGSVLGSGVSTDAISVLTVFGLVLVVAHARGVNLVSTARTLPERLQGHPPGTSGPVDDVPVVREAARPLPDGMIDLAAYSSAATGPAAPVRPRVTAPPACAPAAKAPLTFLTVLVAAGAAAMTLSGAGAYPVPYSSMVVGAVALAVIGVGLLFGGWFRVRGLATVGTLLTFALLASSVVTEVPDGARFGEARWRPMQNTSSQQDFQDYKVAVGSGNLNLTALPVAAGQRAHVNAELLLGEMKITVPRAARVELDARVGFGDLKVTGQTTGGPNARAVRVLEPEGGGKNPPVIVLRIRSKMGDVEVLRG